MPSLTDLSKNAQRTHRRRERHTHTYTEGVVYIHTYPYTGERHTYFSDSSTTSD